MSRIMTFPFRFGWAAHARLGTLLGLSSIAILFSGVDPADFQTSTGIAWNQYRLTEPAVANYIDRLVRLLAVSGAGLAAFVMGIALLGIPQPLTSMPYALLPDPAAPGHLYAGLGDGQIRHTGDCGES